MYDKETFFIETPKAMSYKNFEEDDFSKIFPIEQIGNEDSIDIDNLYFLKRLNSNDSSVNIQNKSEMKKED